MSGPLGIRRFGTLFENLVTTRAYEILTSQPHWEEQIALALRHAPDLPAGPRVLDIGCGYGVSTFVLARALGPDVEVVGVDLSRPMIERAQRLRVARPEGRRTRFLRADARELPLDGDRFDLAVGHSFLYLVPDRRAVLAELVRVLAPRGRLVLMEPSRDGSLRAAAREALVRGPPRALGRPLASARFGTSMATWRLVSGVAGRMTPSRLEALFAEAGLGEFACHPTLGGLGLHATGVKCGEDLQ